MLLVVDERSILAQQSPVASAGPQRNAASVAFTGCRSDGQHGPQEAPRGRKISVPIRLTDASKLSYYSSAQDLGVLAPSGWYCFGTYGSSGANLYVSAQPIDSAKIFGGGWEGLTGPAIQISYAYGDTSGRFRVAQVIARVFPAYKAFASRVMAELIPSKTTPFGPFPGDALLYNSKTVVEYKTPARTDGLGTDSMLKKGDRPIEGVAILVERVPDLILLSVRLPPDLARLTSAVVHQVEREAERRRR